MSRHVNSQTDKKVFLVIREYKVVPQTPTPSHHVDIIRNNIMRNMYTVASEKKKAVFPREMTQVTNAESKCYT